ncbi:MAG: hypothetical protein AAGE52_03850 [Myxococcota bacterium]
MSEPVLAGPIPDDGIVSLLAEIEAQRTTGVLRFRGPAEGEVALVLGQISADQPEREDGEDAVELLLDLRSGEFEVHQRLPPLPVSRGDAQQKQGSLEVHVPADLMNYCERAGLTGLLTLSNDDERAEIIYDRGDLGGIRLDGLDDLHQVFGWEEGSFQVEVFAEAVDFDAELEELELDDLEEVDDDAGEEPEEAAAPEKPESERPKSARPKSGRPRSAPPDSTGKHFLRVVEVTLSEIMKEREERRPATKTSPPLPPMAEPKKHPTLRPPPIAAEEAPKRKERKDQTVRVIYLGGRGAPSPKAPSGTRHVRKDITAEVVLPDASPDRSTPRAPTPTPGAGMTAQAKEPPGSLRQSMGWMLVTIVVVIAALALLAALPPIE